MPFVAAALPWVWVAHRGAPVGHDFTLELTRLAAYSHALRDAQLPPFWAGDLYAGYGSPIFLFYGHVYLAVASLAAVLFGSWTTGAWTALAAFSAFGVWGVQLAARAIDPDFVDAQAGRIAAYVFALHPYLLGDALLRDANAEYVALCIMPFAVYGVLAMPYARARASAALCVAVALVALAHNLSALVVCAAVAALGLAVQRERAHLLQIARAGVIGVLCAGLAWLPALALKSQIRTADLLTGKFDFHRQFRPIATLFDNREFSSGSPLALLFAAAALFALCVKRDPLRANARRLVIALLVAFALLVFVQTGASVAVWELLPWMAFFQFPFRFQGPLALVGALLASVAFAALVPPERIALRRWLEASLLALCILGALPALSQMRAISGRSRERVERALEPRAMRAQLLSGTALDEYVPARAKLELALTPAAQRPVIAALAAEVIVRVLHDEPRRLVLELISAQPRSVCLARWSFDFWELEVDGVLQPLVASSSGCLVVNLPAGQHRVTASLPQPRIRTLGLALSAGGVLAAWLLVLGARRRQQRAARSASGARPEPDPLP